MAELRISAKELLSRDVIMFDNNIKIIIEGVDADNREDTYKYIKKFTSGNIKELNGGIIEITPVDLTQRTRFNLTDLYNIIKILRSENGCEWDKAQDHKSIRSNMIEEAYELVEAINNEDDDNMEEECGDVLLQAVFHSVMAEERGMFDISDVLTRICRKLIDRHTHIFGDVKADNAEQALAAWDKAKAKEKKYTRVSSKMDSIGRAMPSLIKAYKVGKTAAKVGLDFESVEDAADKVKEELNEFLSAEEVKKEEEGGDLLLATVNVLRLKDIEPEVALSKAVDKFVKRFKYIEERIDFGSANAHTLDKLWQDAKGEGL
ncbi:MAG: nucleoside triphosphate pyrophosphohydrolase [Clostridia bacterium]|nr:nucleoside triphosphate pyrophosphohydrolase [Clostridia bacterium]